MSDVVKEVVDIAGPQLKTEMEALANKYVAGFKDLLTEENESTRPVIEAHLKRVAEYRWKAFNADDETTREQYKIGAADELAALRTVLTSESVALTEEAAASFAAGFERVLGAVGSVVKGILGTLVSGIASGAISSVTGGDDFDLGSLLPGA